MRVRQSFAGIHSWGVLRMRQDARVAHVVAIAMACVKEIEQRFELVVMISPDV